MKGGQLRPQPTQLHQTLGLRGPGQHAVSEVQHLCGSVESAVEEVAQALTDEEASDRARGEYADTMSAGDQWLKAHTAAHFSDRGRSGRTWQRRPVG